MNKILFFRECKANYKLLLIFMAVLTMYGSMIVAMFDPELGESLNMMAESMPELFAAFGMLDVGATMIEFVANYLYGFLLIAFPSVFIVLLSNRLLTRYIDRGSMAYLLATPNRRSRIILTQAAAMAFGVLCLVLYVTGLCLAVSEGMFPGEMDIEKFLILNAGLYGLLLFLSSVCFLTAAVFNEGKRATGIGGGLLVAFLLLQMVSQVGDKFEKVKYLTPLTLFSPDGLIAGDSEAYLMTAVLYGMAVVLYGIGMAAFCKRDLPL